MKNSLSLLLFILLIISAGCQRSKISAQQQSQNNQGAGTSGIMSPPSPALQAKAVGEVLPLKPMDKDLKKSVLSHPLPEVWLVFPTTKSMNYRGANSAESTAALRVELPSEAKGILLSQWKVILTSRYNQEVTGLPNAESYVREDVAIVNATDNAARELRKLRIDAIDGRRAISFAEANELVRFMNASAVEVINQAKQYKTEQALSRRSAA